MDSTYEVKGKTLITSSFTYHFKYDVQEVKYWDKIYVVLLNIPNEVNEVDNIFGVDLKGKLVWRIESPIKAFGLKGDEQGYNYLVSSIYVHINLNQNGVFTATTFFAMKYSFDYKNGKLLKKESSRW